MADVDLTPMDPGLLPPIAHASPEGALPPEPRTFTAVRNLEDLVRPDHGLWCSPVTAWSSDGAPTGTAWTDWCATPDELTGLPSVHHGTYTRFTAVEPLPEARIYLIGTADDLDRLSEHTRCRLRTGCTAARLTGKVWPVLAGTPCMCPRPGSPRTQSGL